MDAQKLTVGQAARAIGRSEQTVRNLCERGELEAEHTALGRLIDAASVERWRAAHPVKEGSR